MTTTHPSAAGSSFPPAASSPSSLTNPLTKIDIEEAAILSQNIRKSSEHREEYTAVLNTVFRRIITKTLGECGQISRSEDNHGS